MLHALLCLLLIQPPQGVSVARQLESSDAATREAALDTLNNGPLEAWGDPDIRAALHRSLTSDTVPADFKVAILCSVVGTQRFSLVRRDAEVLLKSPAAYGTLRLFAAAYAAGVDDRSADDPSADLVAFFQRSSGGSRAEAALVIADHTHATLPEELRNEVITVLIEQMLDSEEAPADRGRAIKAAAYFATEDQRLAAALLDLSRPERWFDGTEGAHYLQNSVVDVIHALGQRQASPAVQQRLKTLPADLSFGLDDFNQWLAQGALSIEAKLNRQAH